MRFARICLSFLDPASRRFAKTCLNILVRAIVAAAFWAVLLEISVLLSDRYTTAYLESGGSGRSQEIVAAFPSVYLGIAGVATIITSLVDIVRLVFESIRPSGE